RRYQTRGNGSVRTTAVWPGDNTLRQCVTQTTSDVASSSSQSPLGRRLAAEDHCDPRQIRFGSVSPADEGDQLPRQDREKIRRRSDDPQLEYNSEGGADSQRRVALVCCLALRRLA